jgi:hypothetical protein
MKKLIFFFLSIFISLNLYAQKPVAGDNQIVLGIQGSNTGYLLLKHYYKDDMAKRYAIGGQGLSYSNRPESVYYGSQTKNYSYNVNSFISYGIQKSFDGLEKIEPYIGIDYSLNIAMNKNYYKSLIVDTTGTGRNNLGDYSMSKTSNLSLTLNFKPLIGFNYYIKKNFAVGIEYSLNLFYVGYIFPSSHTSESQLNGLYKYSSNKGNQTFNIGSSFKDNFAITFSYYFKNSSSAKEVKSANQ